MELAVASAVFLAALLVATFVITGRQRAPALQDATPAGSWRAQPSGTTVTLTDVTFVGGMNGWAVGAEGTVLHTSDAGETWERQDSGTPLTLVKVAFVGTLEGWAVGKFGTIIHTSDGGRTWQPQGADAALDLHLASVSFADARTGWAITERGSVMLKTGDGGEVWTRQLFTDTSLRSDMAFIDARRGWVALAGGGVEMTSDGGASWNLAPAASGVAVGLAGMFFLDERNGWTAGWRGKGQRLEFTRFLSDGMVARTTDGGITWSRHDAGSGRALWDIAFVDARRGWAVGTSGSILYSNDGGATWVPQASGTEANLRAVSFPDARTGWAVGEGGTILRFTGR